jgi:hypothetical protein
MTNALDLSAKHYPEPMNHPKRTQEIATILCELLGGDIELPRKIVSLLKEAETEESRNWHIHRLSTRKWWTSRAAECPWPAWELRALLGHQPAVRQMEAFGITSRLSPASLRRCCRRLGGRPKNKGISIADSIYITNNLGGNPK